MRESEKRLDSARAHIIPIALAARPVPNFPRLRALALFGRRLVERAERLSLPASKNLHSFGLMRCNKEAYSITASARARRDAGIFTPSDLAVLRLMMSVYLSDCSMGRSAGLAPFKIRST